MEASELNNLFSTFISREKLRKRIHNPQKIIENHQKLVKISQWVRVQRLEIQINQRLSEVNQKVEFIRFKDKEAIEKRKKLESDVKTVSMAVTKKPKVVAANYI